MKRTTRNIALTAAAFALVLAVGLLTRPLALRLDANFGFHAVLAAFFYGLLAAGYARTDAPAWTLAAGMALYGAAMGAMSPVMAVAAWAPSAAYLAAAGATRARGSSLRARALMGGTVLAGCSYAGVILAGAAFSGRLPQAPDLAFLLASCGLGLLGALVGSARKR